MSDRWIGVPCPQCQCVDTRVTDVRDIFGARTETRQCRHCQRVFRYTPPPAGAVDADGEPVAYDPDPIRCTCPKCQAKNPPVRSTTRSDSGQTVRYHKCTACAFTFKSIGEP